MDNKFEVDAPAKINLGLRVGPATDRGYHAIRTVYQTISLFDRLTFRPARTRTDNLVVSGPVSVPSNSDNLILLALKLARQRGITLPALRIELVKNIPTEAGLGGGSSDAAAALRAVAYFSPDPVSDQLLEELARAIGADVPFFLEQGTVLGTDDGGTLDVLPSLEGKGILAVPPYGIATGWAYRNVETRDQEDLPGLIAPPRRELRSWEELDLTNDFEPLVLEKHELHRRLKGTLTDRSASNALTGSGSSHYALFEGADDRKLDENVAELSEQYSECRWFKFAFIPREER